MRDPALSLKSLKIPELTEIQALELLKKKQVSLALFSWDGCGSVFWLVEGDPESATEAEKFLILLPSARDRVTAGIDWIWGDLLVNKTSQDYPSIGYAFDDSGTLENAFYKKAGPKMFERLERMREENR